MTKLRIILTTLIMALMVIALPAQAIAAPLNYGQLKTMVTNMGYAPNQISKGADSPKFEIATKAGTYNVPLGFEVSPSGRFIWVTANLGTKAITGDQALTLLQRGQDFQPVQFWYSPKGNLMVGMAIDNRDVTPAHLKFVIEKVSGAIMQNADIWE